MEDRCFTKQGVEQGGGEILLLYAVRRRAQIGCCHV